MYLNNINQLFYRLAPHPTAGIYSTFVMQRWSGPCNLEFIIYNYTFVFVSSCIRLLVQRNRLL